MSSLSFNSALTYIVEFKDLILESAQYNMQINVKKTKAMVVTRNEGIQVKLEHEGEYLDQVKDFKFLGSYKSADGDCTNEIKRRIAMARQKAVELTTIWKDKNVTSALKKWWSRWSGQCFSME